jgi:hydrogenase maturation protease
MQTTLVLGLGDRTRDTDEIGPLAIERLERDYVLDTRVIVMDARRVGVHLLPVLTSVQRVLVAAAVRLDAPVGTLHRLKWMKAQDALEPRLPAFRGGIELLRTLHFWVDAVPDVVVLGLEVPPPGGATLGEDTGIGVDVMVRAVVAELRRWGHRLDPRGTARPEPALMGSMAYERREP